MSPYLCPCGSLKNYVDCCQPYLNGQDSVPSAEALMRSRYTAYVEGNILYLEQTAAGEAKENFDQATTQAWNKTVEWLGLKIISQDTEDESATVEFIARFQHQNILDGIHEISRFKQIEGRWFYLGGTWKNFPKQQLSLNSPCWCKNLKKFKNCHGAKSKK